MCVPIDGTYEMSHERCGASVWYENDKAWSKCAFTFHLCVEYGEFVLPAF